jgi:hypothetical protein
MEAPESLNWPLALTALIVGAGLFAAVDVESGLTSSFLTELTALLTPLFTLPLTLELWRQKRIGWGGAVYFVFALSLFHFIAIALADGAYPISCETLLDYIPPPHTPPLPCEAPQTAAFQHVFYAAKAGATGGLAGAALSFAGLLVFYPRLRRARPLALMTVATILLTALGALGLSFTMPEHKTPLQFAEQLFVPWQMVFGLAVLALFDERLQTFGSARVTTPASSL